MKQNDQIITQGNSQDYTGVDERGFVRVDGVVLGRRVRNEQGEVYLEIPDKHPGRSARRGSKMLLVSMKTLSILMDRD